MTRRERAQVVELLRCAADNCITNVRESALGDAARALDRCVMPFLRSRKSDGHWSNLILNDGPIHDGDGSTGDVRLISGTGYEFCLLEAALRVEQGEWP
jgi:hypothetical protein